MINKKAKEAIGLRTIFMGSSSFSSSILETLLKEKYNIISVYTHPEKDSQDSPSGNVAGIAKKYKVPSFSPNKLDEKVLEEIKKQKPDFLIISAYGKILPKSFLELPGFGAINIHPSLLPELRGPSPIQNALLQGKEKTGTTIILMNEKIDAGEILAQKKTNIEKNETYPELLEKLSSLSAKLLLETLPKWAKRTITSQSQDESKATYCQLIERSDGKIIWSNPAQNIYNQFRALVPWPGIFSFWDKSGKNLRIKFHKISMSEKSPQKKHQLGEVFSEEEKVGIQTQKGYIIIEEIQIEGKPKTNIKQFINGYPDFVGSILK